uniref:Cytochrome P450 n=1 Tax=Kalanchoe fedtschenkoi TaxID=63787 RepID=A0A7N0V0V9_KALFE
MAGTGILLYRFWTVENPSLLVCTLLFSLVLIFRFGRKGKSTADSPPPSPWRLPIIGNLHQLSAPLYKGLHALSLKHGPIIRLQLGSIPYCAVSSGDLATQVAKTHESLFSDRRITKGARILFSEGDGVLISPDNKCWRLARKLCVNELLSLRKVQSIHFIRKEEVARLVSMIRSSSDQKIDLSDSFLKLAGSIVSRSVLGRKISSDEDERDNVEGKLALQSAHAITDWFSFEDIIPSLSWLDHLTGLSRRLKNTSQAIHAFLDQVIDERETAGIQSGNEGDDTKCFVDIILELLKKEMISPDFTRGNFRAILLDMFVAGITTSAAAMEWAMTELARNPRIMKKVQEEVRGVVGSQSEIHESDLDRMEYLKCVIKETLRLHGLTLIARQASTTVTIGGFRLPAKVTALINIWAIHRDPAAWDKPLEFLPERFLNTCYNFKGQDQVYFPFGLGRRICPGVDFAMSEVEYALANILWLFDWELPDGMLAEDIDMRATTSVIKLKKAPLCLVPVPVASPACQCT